MPEKEDAPPPLSNHQVLWFDYDTVDVPTLKIPPEKVSKATSFIEFLERGGTVSGDGSFARLTLSVVVGVLQSLVEATPANLGASFLRSLYMDLHSLEAPDLRKSRAYYFTSVELSEGALLDLRWWRQALATGLSKQIQC